MAIHSSSTDKKAALQKQIEALQPQLLEVMAAFGQEGVNAVQMASGRSKT